MWILPLPSSAFSRFISDWPHHSCQPWWQNRIAKLGIFLRWLQWPQTQKNKRHWPTHQSIYTLVPPSPRWMGRALSMEWGWFVHFGHFNHWSRDRVFIATQSRFKLKPPTIAEICWVASASKLRSKDLTTIQKLSNLVPYTVNSFRTYVSDNPERSNVDEMTLLRQTKLDPCFSYRQLFWWILIWRTGRGNLHPLEINCLSFQP